MNLYESIKSNLSEAEDEFTELHREIVKLKGEKYWQGLVDKSKGHLGIPALKKILTGLQKKTEPKAEEKKEEPKLSAEEKEIKDIEERLQNEDLKGQERTDLENDLRELKRGIKEAEKNYYDEKLYDLSKYYYDKMIPLLISDMELAGNYADYTGSPEELDNAVISDIYKDFTQPGLEKIKSDFLSLDYDVNSLEMKDAKEVYNRIKKDFPDFKIENFEKLFNESEDDKAEERITMQSKKLEDCPEDVKDLVNNFLSNNHYKDDRITDDILYEEYGDNNEMLGFTYVTIDGNKIFKLDIDGNPYNVVMNDEEFRLTSPNSLKEDLLNSETFKKYIDSQLSDGAIDDPEYVKTLSKEEYEKLLTDTWMKDKELQDYFLYDNGISKQYLEESEEKSMKEAEGINPNNLTKEQLWKLRQEIVLGSIYVNDYENSFGIEPIDACNFFDSFIEDAEHDDEGNPNDRNIKDYDNAEELYNYYSSCENPFGEIEEIKENTYDIEESEEDDGEYWDDHNDDPIECPIEYEEDGRPFFMYNGEKEYIDDYMKDEAGGAIKPLTVFSAIRIVPSDNGETVSVQYLHDSENKKEEEKKPNFVMFYLNGKELGGHDLANEFDGERESARELFAYENGVKPEEIEVKEVFREAEETPERKDADIQVYMNTWKNYNEYGADLEMYGIKDGWMSPEQALEFCKKYAEDEPFINDVDNNTGLDIEISEYDNAPTVLKGLVKLNEVLNSDHANIDSSDLPLLYEAWSDRESISTPSLENIEKFIDFIENGEYYVHPDIKTTYDIGEYYVDNVGFEGVQNIENYVDSDRLKEEWQEEIDGLYLDDDGNPTEDWYEVDDYMVDEDIEMAAQSNNKQFFEQYFDYESLGDDIYGDGYWYLGDDGAVEIY